MEEEQNELSITGNKREFMLSFTMVGIGVGDDNEPAPENDERIETNLSNEVE